jgi:hypothetical protein
MRWAWPALGILAALGLGVALLSRGGAPSSPAVQKSDSPASPRSAEAAAPSMGPREDPMSEARRLARRDPARSRAVLRAALEATPDDHRLMGALGQKLVLDESLEARALAVQCLNVAPDDPVCTEVLERAIDPDPRDDPTSGFLEGCLEADATRVACLASMGVERLRGGDVDGARTAAARLAEIAADSPLTALTEARVLSAEGKYAEALLRFDAACEAGQTYACYRAQALRRDGW